MLALVSGLAAFGLVVTLVFEIVQVVPKLAGTFVRENGMGANSALRLLIVNRFGAALYFPGMGYLVDAGVATIELMVIVAASLAVFIVVLILLLVNLEGLVRLSVRTFFDRNFSNGSELKEFMSRQKAKLDRIFFASAFAGFFGTLGLTLPMLLGSVFPEIRLTLGNAGFVFNSVFSILTVFIVDKRMAVLCDRRDPAVADFARSVIFGRGVGVAIPMLCYLVATTTGLRGG